MQIIKATYDGQNLVLDERLELAPNTRVTVTVHPEEPEAEPVETVLAHSHPASVPEPRRTKSFAESVRRLRIDGPPDWSERVDYYMGKDVSGGGE